MNYRKKSIIAVLSSMAMAFLCIFHVSSVETEAAVRVMPLGDSITDGFSTSADTASRWLISLNKTAYQEKSIL